MFENTEKHPKLEENKSDEKPNETGGFYFSSTVKIFDPETNEILVQKRGDD